MISKIFTQVYYFWLDGINIMFNWIQMVAKNPKIELVIYHHFVFEFDTLILGINKHQENLLFWRFKHTNDITHISFPI